jgi:hypothetical protein
MKGLGLRFAGISEGRLGADPIQTKARGHKSFPTGLGSVVNWHYISTTTGKHPEEPENPRESRPGGPMGDAHQCNCETCMAYVEAVYEKDFDILDCHDPNERLNHGSS